MTFKEYFTENTENKRLSITVDSQFLSNHKREKDPSFWHQLISYLQSKPNITELYLVIEKFNDFKKLFPVGEELGWVFVKSHVAKLFLSQKPQGPNRINFRHKETELNEKLIKLFPPIEFGMNDRIVRQFCRQFDGILPQLKAAPLYEPQSEPRINEAEINNDGWTQFLYHMLMTPSVLSISAIVIGCTVLFACSGMATMALGSGFVVAGAVGFAVNHCFFNKSAGDSVPVYETVDSLVQPR